MVRNLLRRRRPARLLGLALGLSASAAWATDAPSATKRLKAWLEPVMASTHRELLPLPAGPGGETRPAIGEADLDGDGVADAVACVVRTGPGESSGPGREPVRRDLAPEVVVALSSGGERFWFLPMREEGAAGVFPGCPLSFWPAEPRGPVAMRDAHALHLLELGDANDAGSSIDEDVVFSPLGPRVVQYAQSSRFDHTLLDFAELHRRDANDSGGSEPKSFEAAVLLAGTRAEPPGKVPTWITWGQKRWTGDSDAALRVSAVHDENTVTVHLQAIDDVVIPVADAQPKHLLGGDHFELWWDEPRGRVQLGVGLDARGEPVQTWFVPPMLAHDLPRVRREGRGVAVELPRGWLLWGPQGDAAFAVAYSDADEAGVGQQTLVTTLSQRPSRKGSLGTLWLNPVPSGLPVLSTAFAPWCRVGRDGELIQWLAQADRSAR